MAAEAQAMAGSQDPAEAQPTAGSQEQGITDYAGQNNADYGEPNNNSEPPTNWKEN